MTARATLLSILIAGIGLFLTPSPAAADAGEVNVYSARHYDADDALYERFTDETGIRVNVIEGKSDELIARLEREGRLSPADLFITVDAGRLHRAVERGVFQPIDSATFASRIPATLRHPDDLWFGLTKRARVIVASTERVPADAQLDYEDLADPAWRGRVLVRSSSNIYNQSLVASMIASEGAEAAEAWCEGLVRNFARRPQGGDRDQIRAIAAGEGDVAIVNHYYYAQMLEGGDADRQAASKVRVIFPNQDGRGTHVNISGAGVVKGAPNEENAIRLLEFLASDESQRTLAAGTQEYPVVEGVSLTSTLEALGGFRSDGINASRLGEFNAEAVRMMDRAGWR
jgi:iron(III) transport system substrate-binding protein